MPSARAPRPTAAHPRLLVVLGAALALGAAGCPRSAEPPDARADQRTAAPPPETRPPRPFERCAAVDAPQKPPLQLTFAGAKLALRGAVLGPAAGAPKTPTRARLRLAALGDVKQASEQNLAQLERLSRTLRAQRVDAVVLLGGIDATFEGTRAILDRLKPAAPVVLALPGDRVSRSGFQAAAGGHAPTVVDLVRVRAVQAPGATLVAIPGYHLPHHLLAREQGCSFTGDDLQAVARLVKPLPAPRVLLAHTPPRGSGAEAVDRAFGAVNIGAPGLTRLMREAHIAFGLFAHVHESAGHATTVEGTPVPPMTWSSSLLLQVGSADTVPHEDLAGAWSRGSAALFELRGERARYRMLELQAPPRRAAPKAQPGK